MSKAADLIKLQLQARKVTQNEIAQVLGYTVRYTRQLIAQANDEQADIILAAAYAVELRNMVRSKPHTAASLIAVINSALDSMGVEP